jgi:hypothetical protein
MTIEAALKAKIALEAQAAPAWANRSAADDRPVDRPYPAVESGDRR